MTASRAHPASAVQRGLEVLAATQDPGGSWKGDYGGPLFLVPEQFAVLPHQGLRPQQD